MKNARFYELLRIPQTAAGEPMWNVQRLATEIGSSRSHVTEVLNNQPGHGHQTRRKLVRLFRRNFTYWPDLLLALGWTVEGKIVLRGTLEIAGDSQSPIANSK